MKDGGSARGDLTAFVGLDDAAGPVDQFEIVGQATGHAFWHGLARVASELEQRLVLLLRMIGAVGALGFGDALFDGGVV